MPCPNCNAPDIQNARANYCYYCGHIFNPAVKNENEKPDKALNIFAIFVVLQIIAITFYLLLPLFLQTLKADMISGVYKLTGCLFAICEIILLILAAVFIKQKNLKVLFIIFGALRFLLLIVSFIPWR